MQSQRSLPILLYYSLREGLVFIFIYFFIVSSSDTTLIKYVHENVLKHTYTVKLRLDPILGSMSQGVSRRGRFKWQSLENLLLCHFHSPLASLVFMFHWLLCNISNTNSQWEVKWRDNRSSKPSDLNRLRLLWALAGQAHPGVLILIKKQHVWRRISGVRISNIRHWWIKSSHFVIFQWKFNTF